MASTKKFSDLAEFVVGWEADPLPQLAVRRAADAITDCVGCALAGSKEPIAAILRRVLPISRENDGTAPLLGSSDRATPSDAALYNGTLAHALDFDDIAHPAYAHPSAVLVPAIISFADIGNVSGREAVVAYIIGLEVFGKLGRALNTAHYRSGWHATSTFGSLAAAAAGARLLRLDVSQTRAALGIAGSAASGLRANFGTMTKPLHSGYAARNGVLAALLAREGFTANEELLTHKYGFASVFNHGSEIRWDALDRWGEELEVLSEFGLALKPYPSCGATHPAIEAAILVRKDLSGDVDEVEDVHVGVPRLAFEPLIYQKPETPLEGKFSMHYVIAAALCDGTVNLGTFTPEKIGDERIGRLLAKVRMEADERVEASSEFAAIVTARTRNGKTHERSVPLAIGKPARWLGRDDLRAKFVECARFAISQDSAEHAFERFTDLTSAERLGAELATLVP